MRTDCEILIRRLWYQPHQIFDISTYTIITNLGESVQGRAKANSTRGIGSLSRVIKTLIENYIKIHPCRNCKTKFRFIFRDFKPTIYRILRIYLNITRKMLTKSGREAYAAGFQDY